MTIYIYSKKVNAHIFTVTVNPGLTICELRTYSRFGLPTFAFNEKEIDHGFHYMFLLIKPDTVR